MNTQNLPKAFAIRCEAFDTEQLIVWYKFIAYMNSMNPQERQWAGDSIDDYYAIYREESRTSIIGSISHTNLDLLTLDMFAKLIEEPIVVEESEEEVQYTMCFDDELYPVDECHEFPSESIHEGNFYSNQHRRNGEVVYCEFGDYYAHVDEVSSCNGSYFITEEGYNHDIEWSEYNDEYIDTNDCFSHYGIYNSRGHEGWFSNDYYVHTHGQYYASSDVAEANGFWYDNDEDEWVNENDRNSVKRCNAKYHDLSRVNRFTIAPKFSIGFEIEKEDSDAGLVHYQDLYDSTNGWIKESDGSLNDNGYELVSPAFDLYSDLLDKEIKGHRDLITLINGSQSHRCGGHINIASSEYTPDQLFEGLSGFLPLIYSMYPHRINVDYSRAKKKHEYFNKSKYSAVFIKDNLVEFRIFSGVKSIENLIWRRDLMRIMCDNINKSEKEVLRMLVSPNTKLHKHMRKVYTHEGLVDKIMKFVDHSAYYNNKKIENVNVSAIKKTSTGLAIEISDELAC